MKNMKTTLIAVLSLPFLCAGPALASAVLSLSGPASPVAAGSPFTISVNITGAVDLSAYQFDVGYDPLLFVADSVQEGPFLQTAGATFFIPGMIDNSSGSIALTAGALAGMGPGASGDGVLATLSFRGVSAGTAQFTLISPLLYDTIPNPIEVTTSGASVTVSGSAVPEPASVLLTISSLLLFAVRRKR